MTITLKIQGLGHVPSFKNSKMLCRGRLITDPKKQRWMEQATRAIELQFLSVIRTTVGETWTAEQQRSWTALSAPLDDSWQWVPVLIVEGRKVAKGEEGATITIEQILS